MSTFNPPADIAQITLAKSSDVNAIKAATAIAFGLLPSETKLQRGTVNFNVDTGTTNAYAVALDASIIGYTDGLQVVFRPLNTNTGTATINLNGIGARSIVLTNSDPIQAGDISAGAIIDVRYSTATGFFHLTPNSAIYAHDAGVSADAAAASAVASAGSASDALSYRNAAEGYKNTASASAAEAGSSAVASAGSASDALSYRNSAEGYKNTAVSSAAAASSSAVASAGSASDALSYRNTAEGYKNAAGDSATAAGSSATAAAASYDSFDDRYLGAKASDPTLDNDGNALLTGALYWNSASNEMRVYSGSAWVTAYLPAAGYLALSGGTLTGDLAMPREQVGSSANFTRFPNALAVTSTVPVGIQQNESLYIGQMAESFSVNTTWASGLYGVAYTNNVGNGRATGVTGEAHVATSGDTGSAVGVRGYANDTHSGGYNIGLYADASGSTFATHGGNVALFIANGNILTSAAAPKTWYLGGNLIFDGQGGTPSITTANGATLISTGLKSATTDIAIGSATAPTTGQVLTATSSTDAAWQSLPSSIASVVRNPQSSAYTVVAGDKGTLIEVTSGTFTLSLTAAATLGSGWWCYVSNIGTGLITIDPNSSETITVNGTAMSTWVQWTNEIGILQCDGTGFSYYQMQKGYTQQTVSSAVSSVNFTSGVNGRRKLRLTISNVDVTSALSLILKVNSSNFITSKLFGLNTSTGYAGYNSGLYYFPNENIDPSGGTSAKKQRASADINFDGVEIIATSHGMGGYTGAQYKVDTSIGFIVASTMTSINLITSTSTLSAGTFTLTEL